MNKPRAFSLAMLNSSLDDHEIEPFLDALLEQGYEGIAWHPRDGLRVPYATRAFWDGMDRLIGAARKRGLEVWFYDEFPFPSGMAGGLVPDEVAPGLHELQWERIEPTPNRDGVIDIGPGQLVALVRVHDGIAQDVTADSGPYLDTWVWGEWHNRYYTGTINVHEELHERGVADRYTRAYLPATPMENDELYAVKSVPVGGRRGQRALADVSQPATTDRFCEITFQPFAALAKKHELGAAPIFQDEVTYGCAWPWNDLISSALRAQWGEGFGTALWAIGEPGRPGWESARAAYREVCAATIEAGWFARVEERAHQLGLATAGHLPGEESILGHCQFMGDAFKMLSHFDVPGYDIISSTLPDGINRGQATGAKLVQSSAWLQGKSSMVEAFGANGFALDVQKQRSVLAWLACHDLIRVFDHSTYISAHGPRKYDAPPVSTRFDPMSHGRADLWNWHAQLCNLFDEYRFAPRTLVIFPIASLARYTLGEEEQWRDPASLLETWFHTLCAASMDCVFLPVEELANVHPEADGFTFRGARYESLWLPPVESLHEATAAALQQFASHPHFYCCVPDGSVVSPDTASGTVTIPVFGAADTYKTITARNILPCREVELLQHGAQWFAPFLHLDSTGLMSDECILQTVRVNAAGQKLRAVINPHDREVSVRFASPHREVALGGAPRRVQATMTLAPREVLLLQPCEAWPQATQPAHINAQVGRVRFAGPNAVSLTEGMARLDGANPVAFRPEPVSSLWQLPVALAHTDAVFAAPYSREPLPAPRRLEAEFKVKLGGPLEELAVLLDADSSPPGARLLWDGQPLEAHTRAIFDTLNTVYPIPATLLDAGEHYLLIESCVTHAAQGVLERPLLVGQFAAFHEVLHPMPRDWQLWNGESWPGLGMPAAPGPVEYEWIFEAHGHCELELPHAVGVAEVWVNEQPVGRSSWEPRRLQLGPLAGTTVVRARLHGSWNNVFSQLNRVQNGFRSHAVLHKV